MVTLIKNDINFCLYCKEYCILNNSLDYCSEYFNN